MFVCLTFRYVAKMVNIKAEKCPVIHTYLFDCYIVLVFIMDCTLL